MAVRMNEDKKKPTLDFSTALGKERKNKLKRIAAANNRTMSSQIREWIDKSEDPANRK